jgi:hypothetical protein
MDKDDTNTYIILLLPVLVNPNSNCEAYRVDEFALASALDISANYANYMLRGYESLNYVVARECPRESVLVSFVSAVSISQSCSQPNQS